MKLKKCTSWGFKEFSFEVDERDEVKSISCVVCKEFYTKEPQELEKLKGAVKESTKSWIQGSKTIKKCNAETHLKSNVHAFAQQRLKFAKTNATNPTPAEKIAKEKPSSQSSIVEHVRKANAKQIKELTKKFQLAHFLTVENKSFEFYQSLVRFEKDFHKVDLGTGYLNRQACHEMVIHLSKSLIIENITEPLNEGERLYFSLLFDGSSSAKTMDEKEVYIIKTCDKGTPRYDVLALEQPDDANALGLKKSLDDAVSKAKFTFDRKNREIGLGSDGTNTNKALFRLEKEQIGDHLILILCLNHKLELAIHDAFEKNSSLNEDAEEQLSGTYYLFRRANLKWRLFKRHAKMIKKQHRRYKRSSGTRWVSHQTVALDTLLHNIEIFIGYLNNQIADPHNATMKKERQRLEGVLSNCTSLVVLIFNTVKADVLRLIQPTSLVLESTKILLPEAITTISITSKKIAKLRENLDNRGKEVLKDEAFFPTFNNELLPMLEFDEDGVTLGRSTRRAPSRVGVTTLGGYTLTGPNLEDALSTVHKDIKKVVSALEEALTERFSSFLDDPVISAASILLDTAAYVNKDEEEIKKACLVIHNHFALCLTENGFQLRRLGKLNNYSCV